METKCQQQKQVTPPMRRLLLTPTTIRTRSAHSSSMLLKLSFPCLLSWFQQLVLVHLLLQFPLPRASGLSIQSWPYHRQRQHRQQVQRLHTCHSSLRQVFMTLTEQEHVPVQLQLADYSCDSSSFAETDAPPVLLLHGLLGSKRNFASLGTALAQQLVKKRKVIALDLRNHGDNTDFRQDMTYDSMAMDVISIMDQNNIHQVVLVGHSMGAKVCSTLALTHPHRVAGLVVLDMAPVTYSNDDAAWNAVQDIIRLLSDLDLSHCKSKRDVDLLLRPALPDPALRAFVLTNLNPSTPLQWKIPMQSICSQLPTLAGFQVPPSSQYPGDAFFIHGGQSKFVRNVHLEQIASYFPNHMLTTIRGAGHWIHAEAPDDVLALLKRYLDR
jgi:esterase